MTLTNSAPQTADAQLINAGISHFFEKRLSVDTVKKFKPALEVYQMAAETIGEAPSNLIMIAAHDWDIQGAMNAGFQGAFVARPGQTIPAEVRPQIIGKNLLEVAEQILKTAQNG